MKYIEPEAGALENLAKTYPADTPVVMLNLLRFSERAHYEPGADAEPCSGAEAYDRYSAAVLPLLEEQGATLLWQGNQTQMVFGPDDKDWHLVVLVKYPSPQAFVDMVSGEEYRAIVFHRSAALADSRLIAMQEL